MEKDILLTRQEYSWGKGEKRTWNQMELKN